MIVEDICWWFLFLFSIAIAVVPLFPADETCQIQLENARGAYDACVSLYTQVSIDHFALRYCVNEFKDRCFFCTNGSYH
jgi:hypothetical protein